MITGRKYAKKRWVKPHIELSAAEYLKFRFLCMRVDKSMTAWLKEMIQEHVRRMPDFPEDEYSPRTSQRHTSPAPPPTKRTLSSQKQAAKSKGKAGTKPKKVLASKAV